MSSLSRDLEAVAARAAEEVQAAEEGLVVEARRPSHQVVVVAVEEFRLVRQLEERLGRWSEAMEERLGRWLAVAEVAEAHLLLARAVEAVQRKLAVVVQGERWRLVEEAVPPGFSQVDPASVGSSEEEEAARPIQGLSEEVVAAGLAGQRSSLATEAEEARRHDSVEEEGRSSDPGMPEARRTCGLVLWCLRRETFPAAVEGEGQEQEP